MSFVKNKLGFLIASALLLSLSACGGSPNSQLVFTPGEFQRTDIFTDNEGFKHVGVNSAGNDSTASVSGPQNFQPDQMLLFNLVVTRDGAYENFTVFPENHVTITFYDEDGVRHVLPAFSSEKYVADVKDANSSWSSKIAMGAGVLGAIASVGGVAMGGGDAAVNAQADALMQQSVTSFEGGAGMDAIASDIGEGSRSNYFATQTLHRDGDSSKGLVYFGVPEDNEMAMGPFEIRVVAGRDVHVFRASIVPGQ